MCSSDLSSAGGGAGSGPAGSAAGSDNKEEQLTIDDVSVSSALLLEVGYGLIPLIEEYRKHFDFTAYVPISARRRDGIKDLTKEIVKHLPVGPAIYEEDYLTDQPERFLAAEVIREKILHQTTQEVPHAVAVVIDEWKEEPRPEAKPNDKRLPMLRIAATIIVEKAGQKAILIGAGGAAIKKTGTQARQELERLFDRKVFLELLVKVRAGWRDDPAFFRSIDWRGTGM